MTNWEKPRTQEEAIAAAEWEELMKQGNYELLLDRIFNHIPGPETKPVTIKLQPGHKIKTGQLIYRDDDGNWHPVEIDES